MLAQIHRLHAVMGRKISRLVVDGDVVDCLALRHVLVIQVAHIPDTMIRQHIDLAVLIGYQKRLGRGVIMDHGDTGAMQSRTVVIEFDLFGLLIHRKQTTVRQGIHTISAQRDLLYIVVCKIRRPLLCLNSHTDCQQQSYPYVSPTFHP